MVRPVVAVAEDWTFAENPLVASQSRQMAVEAGRQV